MSEAGKPIEHYLRLVPGEHAVTATLRLLPGFCEDTFSADALLRYLDSKTIQRGLVNDASIDELVDLARRAFGGNGAGETAAEFVETVVAEGEPPEHGRDASIRIDPLVRTQVDEIEERRKLFEQRRRQGRLGQLLDEDDAAPTRGGIEPDGPDGQPMDFRSMRTFVVVRENQLIGQVIDATPGVDGMDVYGKAVAAKPGASLSVKFGPGVEKDASGRVVSTVAGKLTLSDSEIRVDPKLEIPKSVDFSTGNIDFPGEVNVGEGVKDRFVVRAGGSVTVRDLVEAATLESDRDIRIDAGMVGRGKGRLSTRGDVNANYLDGVIGDVGRDLRVTREVNGCALRIGGAIDSPSCVILGGDVSVGQRVDITQVGGEGGIETRLVVGCLPELEDLLGPLLERIARIEEDVTANAGELQALRGQQAELTPDQVERLTELQFVELNGEELKRKVALARLRLVRTIRSHTLTSLTVRKAIFPGAKVWVRGWRIEPDKPVRGPILIELNEDNVPVWKSPKDAGPGQPLSSITVVRPDPRLAALPKVSELDADLELAGGLLGDGGLHDAA